jgi:hypothetical protein
MTTHGFPKEFRSEFNVDLRPFVFYPQSHQVVTTNAPHQPSRRAQSALRPVTIRQARFEDYPQISALQAKYKFPRRSFSQWKHLWANNPAYLQSRGKFPIGWVLEREDGQLAGYLGNIPLFYEFGGQRVFTSVAHAWVVDSEYRSYSLLLLDRYFSQPSVELFLNATVGPDAFDAFATFNSLPVPTGSWDRASFWITNCRGFTACWLAMKEVAFAKPLSYLVSAAPFIKQKFWTAKLPLVSTRLDLHECVLIDDRFDEFWSKLKRSNPNVLFGVRSREILQWHYQQALSQNRAWLVTANAGGVMKAYAIFFRHDNEILHLKRMRLVDFQTLDNDPALLTQILDWGLTRCRREGIDMLESIGLAADKGELISKGAPFNRKLPCWLYFYNARERCLADKLADPRAWEPSQFDGDASL